ncbi:CAP domain-containing protein, partial [Streptomyces sp. NPDC088762]|uniref:CAP domain-containing protein n=1 Tax=Streptomyces sp. NPDC088762 TaxID=3365891 RepID=UPI003808C8F9
MKRNAFATAAAVICGLAMMGSTTAASAYAAAVPVPASERKAPLCPSSDPPPGTGSAVSSADAAEIVRVHNEARRAAIQKYNPGLPVVSVVWNARLACDAQAWADDPESTQGGRLHHSNRETNGHEGENLFSAFPGPARPVRALDSWLAEKSKFDADNNAPVDSKAAPGTNYRAWGHYSQMVWMSPSSSTTAVGCGVKEGVPVGDTTGWVVVCRYTAAGNIGGERAIPPGGAAPVPQPPPPPRPPATQPFRGISSVSQRDDHLDVFWVGPDGSVRSQWWDGKWGNGAWDKHGSFNIAPAGSAAANSGIASVSQRDDHLDVFWVGPDGSVRSQWWDGKWDNGAWDKHGSFNIAPAGSAAANSGIASVSQRDNHLDVFWLGPDGSVRSQWWDGKWDNGPWDKHGSFNIAPAGSAAANSGIASVSQRDNHLDV